MALKVDNLLDTPGYSAVPYGYGAEVVKYAIAPSRLDAPPAMPEAQAPPQDASEDYLEDAMNATLLGARQHPVSFGFFIQRRQPDDSIAPPSRAKPSCWVAKYAAT